MKGWSLGVDIGGSHITCARVHLRGKKIDLENVQREVVDSTGTADQIFEGWVEVLRRFPKETFSGIGIAMPAPFDYKLGISYLKTQGKLASLYGMNVKELLADQLGISPSQISFSNDAAAYLQGEVSFIGLDDSVNYMGITLGTGLGSAFKLGAPAYDAELWSSPFKDGIAEDYLGTKWFEKWVSSQYGIRIRGVKTLLELPDPSISDEAFSIFGENLGEFLAPHIESNAIDTLIIGGNIGKAERAYLHHAKRVFRDSDIDITIRISKLGEIAPVFGAVSVHSIRENDYLQNKND